MKLQLIRSTSARIDGSPDRELTTDELDQVSGGLVVNAIIAVMIGLLVPEDTPRKH